jgi:hypothetical protein
MQNFLSLFFAQIPLIAVASVGLWFAVSKRRSMTGASSWAGWGFSLLIAYSLASPTLSALSLKLRTDALVGSVSVAAENFALLSFLTVAAYPLLVVGIALIARAVFLGRNGSESE